MQDRPYFMQNKEWYRFDFKSRRYVLTDKAPEKAKQSLKDFYRIEKQISENKAP